MSGTLEGYALADNEHASEAERGNVRVVVEPSWVTVELCSRDAGTLSTQIPRAVFAELFRRVAQR